MITICATQDHVRLVTIQTVSQQIDINLTSVNSEYKYAVAEFHDSVKDMIHRTLMAYNNIILCSPSPQQTCNYMKLQYLKKQKILTTEEPKPKQHQLFSNSSIILDNTGK